MWRRPPTIESHPPWWQRSTIFFRSGTWAAEPTLPLNLFCCCHPFIPTPRAADQNTIRSAYGTKRRPSSSSPEDPNNGRNPGSRAGKTTNAWLTREDPPHEILNADWHGNAPEESTPQQKNNSVAFQTRDHKKGCRQSKNPCPERTNSTNTAKAYPLTDRT